MKDRETETTVTIDMRKFPREYWTGDENPFMRLDEQQLDDVDNWIRSLIPKKDAYCAEVVGRAPIPVSVLIGGVLMETGCIRVACIHPGNSVTIVWDYTASPERNVDEAARQEVLERIGCKPGEAQ